MYLSTNVQALPPPLVSLSLCLPLPFGGSSPVKVWQACVKSVPSKNSTRAITSPLPPQPRQLNTCLVVLMENRSSPPHLGHGPSRSTVPPLSLMPRRPISSSMRTVRALATQLSQAGDLIRFPPSGRLARIHIGALRASSTSA